MDAVPWPTPFAEFGFAAKMGFAVAESEFLKMAQNVNGIIRSSCPE